MMPLKRNKNAICMRLSILLFVALAPACKDMTEEDADGETGTSADSVDDDTTESYGDNSSGDDTEAEIDPDTLPIGLPHREQPWVCPQTADDPPVKMYCNPENPELDSTCVTQGDCNKNDELGFCMVMSNWEWPTCDCNYDECLTDEDCENGDICACSGRDWADIPDHENLGKPPKGYRFVNLCMPAECKKDTDCDSGLCFANRIVCYGEVFVEFRCATEHDKCRSDEICEIDDRRAICASSHFDENMNDIGSTSFACQYNWDEEMGRLWETTSLCDKLLEYQPW
jgi:hypothetical protein